MYFRDNISDDLGIYLSIYELNRGGIIEVIKNIEKLLKNNQRETDNNFAENKGEIIWEGQIDDELALQFVEAMQHLKTAPYFNLILVKAFSFLEFSLADLCRVFERKGSNSIKFVQFNSKHQGIDKSKEYLRKEFGIPIGDENVWPILKNYQSIRNLIVHNNANIYKDYDLSVNNQKDYIVIKELEREISISETAFIFIKDIQYIKTLVEITDKLLTKIIIQLKQKFDIK